MAPEQIEGGDVDGRADVFGMGVLLYECLVGHLPFEGNNPAQVLRRVLDGIYPSAERERPVVGKTWSVLVDRALARRPEDRFESAQAMKDAIAAELSRVGFGAARPSLEAYLDAPEAWTAAHDAAMIGKLCDLGSSARRRGDALAAAADYNRALAYAPTDPALLRIVASMHRAEGRRRFVRRLAPLAAVALVATGSAYGIARAVKANGGPDPVGPRTGVDPGPREPRPGRATTVAGGAGAPGGASAAPSSSPPKIPASRTSVTVATPAVAPGRKTTRTVSGTLSPRYGVHMELDGAPAGTPEGRFAVTLDDKPHVLSFTCRDAKGAELCVPKNVNVGGGDKDEAFDVALQILPARLLVQGPAGSAYGIEEMPGVTLAAGVAADITMPSGVKDVTVYDRADFSRKKSVRLLAGKNQSAAFDTP